MIAKAITGHPSLSSLVLLFFLAWHTLHAQTIQGRVVDARTGKPLPYAQVSLLTMEDSLLKTTFADSTGYFSLTAPAPSKFRVKVQFFGYTPATVEVIAYPRRNTTLEIPMKISYKQLPAVTIREHDQPHRKAATDISRIRLYPSRTLRYAGTLGDAIRTVQTLPSVYTVSDMRNDLVIRGNTPWGVLYRVEDLDVPSPHHFSEAGMSAGPISILNNNTIAHMDFYAGAFPPELVGAYSGAFTIQLARGNYTQHQGIFQVGWTGLEFLLEGPLHWARRASYLVSYRYSFLDFLKLLGVRFGTAAIPRYQDLTFTIHLPGKWETRLWGIGGLSTISFEEIQEHDQQGLTVTGLNLDFSTQTGATGIRTVIPLPEPGYGTLAMGVTHSAHTTSLERWDSTTGTLRPLYYNTYRTQTFSTHLKGGVALKRIHLRGGILLDYILSQNNDTIYLANGFRQSRRFKGSAWRARQYLQAEFGFTSRMTVTTGFATRYFSLPQRSTVDAHLSMEASLSRTTEFRAGYSLLSLEFPLVIYQLTDPTLSDSVVYPFRALPFMRAHHVVGEIHQAIGNNWRIVLAAYVQHLWNIPVDGDRRLGWWALITEGLEYGLRVPVVHPVPEGIGRNTGIELTVQRRFVKGTYALFTLSLFDSRYKAIDGNWYPTPYNGNFVTNLLWGTEFPIRHSAWTGIIDLRLFWTGGRRHHPIDTPATLQAKQIVWDYSQPFARRVPNYFRLDLKIGLRLSKKVSQEWLLYLQNVTNHKNIYSYEFSTVQNKIIPVYQMGFIPVMLYRLLW